MKKLYIFLLLNLFITPLWADTFSYDFIKNFSSASSLGQTNAALCDTSNMSGLIFNPAVNAFLLKNEVQVNYHHNLGENYYWFGASYQFNSFYTSLNYLTTAIFGFEETTVSGKMPVKTGTMFNYSLNIFMGNISYQLLDNLSAGINIKTSLEKIYQANASALALDLGFLYILSDNFKISASLLNLLSTNKTWDSGLSPEEIPKETLFGGELSLLENNLNLSLYIAQIPNLNTTFGTGLSYVLIKDQSFIRCGLDSRRLTCGIGLAFDTITFDYAFSKPHEDYLENSHCFSLTFKLNSRTTP